jgi:SAM-dependent methyltransferase
MTHQPTNDDVPSPIDFANDDDVRSWVEETARNRPWRPEFFKAFASQLRSHLIAPATIAELGSGPGFLAEEILQSCDIIHYCLVDFSEPMHELARERLRRFEGLTEYLMRDFRSSNWTDGLSGCDAVVSMQAVHEVRHKRHVPTLYGHIFRLLRPGGCFLVADRYATDKN